MNTAQKMKGVTLSFDTTTSAISAIQNEVESSGFFSKCAEHVVLGYDSARGGIICL